MSRYDDIITRKYEGSITHNRMSLENRAAQFAPFAALTGHNEAINETARLTSERLELSAEEQSKLSERLNIALNSVRNNPVLTFSVFKPDTLKSGGRYISVIGTIKKYDEYDKAIILTNEEIIHIEDIVSIDGEIFNDIFD